MWKPEDYGEHFAERYDDLYGPLPEAAIECLAARVGPDGRALELGIETGRVALPLLAKGVAVQGIDSVAGDACQAGLLCLQHPVRPAPPGRPGKLLSIGRLGARPERRFSP